MILVCKQELEVVDIETDASYVIKGADKLGHAGPSGVPSILRGRNGDMWRSVLALSDKTQCNMTKVKAHMTAADVAAGRISFQSYAANATADALAAAASQLSAQPEAVRRMGAWHMAIAFSISMRIAVTEEIVHRKMQDTMVWDVLMASAKVTEQQAIEQQSGIAELWPCVVQGSRCTSSLSLLWRAQALRRVEGMDPVPMHGASQMERDATHRSQC